MNTSSVPLPWLTERTTIAFGRTGQLEATSSIRKLGSSLASWYTLLELPFPRGQWAWEPAYVRHWILFPCLQPSNRDSTEKVYCAHAQAVALSEMGVSRETMAREVHVFGTCRMLERARLPGVSPRSLPWRTQALWESNYFVETNGNTGEGKPMHSASLTVFSKQLLLRGGSSAKKYKISCRGRAD